MVLPRLCAACALAPLHDSRSTDIEGSDLGYTASSLQRGEKEARESSRIEDSSGRARLKPQGSVERRSPF